MLVVLAHPSLASLNHALARAAVAAAEAAGAAVALHDLYRDGFDPRLQAAEVDTSDFADELAAGYARDLLAADLLVVVHPVWFFQLPATLKGWVDRVVRQGVAFDLDAHGNVTGRLRTRSALVVTTGNASAAVEREVFGDPVTRFWRDVVLAPAGVGGVERLAFSPVRGSTDAARAAWLRQVGEAVGEAVEQL